MKVRKKTLVLIAGIVWLIAGFNVARIGIAAYAGYETAWHILLSIGVFCIFGMMFFRMSMKHIARILSYEAEIHSVFRFFDLKSYGIMAFMMTGGIWLRYSNLVPMSFIAVFYSGLGMALAMAGVIFIVQYMKLKKV